MWPGYAGYAMWAPQVARRVAPTDTVDPAAMTVLYHAGPADFPQLDWQAHPNTIEPVGQGSAALPADGRREFGQRLRLLLADPALVTYAVPDLMTNPAPVNTAFGLPYITLQVGIIGSGEVPAQFVDCLINSLELEFSEGQAVQASLELMAVTAIPGIAVGVPDLPDGHVLHWVHTGITLGDLRTDVRSSVSRVRVSIRNNVVRKGVRPRTYTTPTAWFGGDITGLTCTAVSMRPGVHSVDVAITSRNGRDLAADIIGSGGLVVTCEHPVSSMYPTRRRLVVEIQASAMASGSVQSTPAGSVITYSTQLMPYASPTEPTITIST